MKWNVTNEEMILCQKIGRRASELKYAITPEAETSVCMSIVACHANGTRLRLDDLLNARDFDFAHDVLGIMGHINTRTGKLRKYWSPRFAVPEVSAPHADPSPVSDQFKEQAQDRAQRVAMTGRREDR